MNNLEAAVKKIDNGATALAAHIGKSYPTAQKYISGESQPTLDVAQKIEEYLGVPMAEFYTEYQPEKLAQAA